MMDRKRKAAFTANVLNKLYPPIPPNKEESIPSSSSVVSGSKAQENKDEYKSKVYGAYLPPHIQQQLRAADINSEQVSSSADDDDSDEGERSPKKRRRKKRRKGKMHRQASEIISKQPQQTTDIVGLDMIDINNTQQTEIIETHGLSNAKISSNDEITPLTKNQKRKLRKKRRQKALTKEGSCEFTFEQGGENRQTETTTGKQENVSTQIQEFMQAVWDIVIRDDQNGHQLQQASFNTFLVLLGHLESEHLKSLLHWKQYLIVQDADGARKQIQTFNGILSNEHVAVLSSLTEYWFKGVIQFPFQPT